MKEVQEECSFWKLSPEGSNIFVGMCSFLRQICYFNITLSKHLAKKKIVFHEFLDHGEVREDTDSVPCCTGVNFRKTHAVMAKFPDTGS